MQLVLRVIVWIYGIFYLVYIVDSFLPAKDYNPFDTEHLTIKLGFLLYLIGLFCVYKSELVAGFIFVIWWLLMWLIAFVLTKTDPGAAMIFGVPVFIVGLFYLFRNIKIRKP